MVGNRFVAIDVQGAYGDRLRRHELDHFAIFSEQFFLVGKLRAIHVLKFRAVKTDAVAAIIFDRNDFFREFYIGHYLQPDAVGCFSAEMTFAGDYGLVFLVANFSLFIFNQCLLVGMNDDRTGISINDDQVVAFDCAGGCFKPHHGRDLKSLSHDTGVGCFTAAVGYKSHNSCQVYLAGFSR